MPRLLHRHHDVEAGGAHFGDGGLQLRIEHLDHAAPFGAAVVPDSPRSPSNSPSALSRREFSASSSANSTNRIASGSPRRNASIVGLKIAMSRASPSMVRSISSTAIGPELDDVLRRRHRFVETAEMAGADGAAAEQRRKFQFDRGREGQRAFGADQQMREIDRRSCRGRWRRDCSRRRGAALSGNAVRSRRLRARRWRKIAHQLRRRIGPWRRPPAEMRVRAVGENGIDRDHVLARIAVTQRARAAGIVADHAADGGARGGRDVDRKPQARRFQRAIEFVEHDARLDHAAARRGIERDDAVEMSRAIDDQRLVDGLPGLRRAAAARRDRHAFGAANRDRPFSFFYRARRHTPSGMIW